MRRDGSTPLAWPVFVLLSVCDGAIGSELVLKQPQLKPAHIQPFQTCTYRVAHSGTHKTHARMQPLHLRGGVTTHKATFWFVLTNFAVYVIIHKAMTSIGGIRFITVSCWCVWALWLLSSALFKRLAEQALQHPKETMLALASSLLNIDEPDRSQQYYSEARRLIAEGVLQPTDVIEHQVVRGELTTIPSDHLVLDCDNGVAWEKLDDGSSVEELLDAQSDIVTLELVEEKRYIQRRQHAGADAFEDEEESIAFEDEEVKTVTFTRGEPFLYPKGRLMVGCDNGLGDSAAGGSVGIGNCLASVAAYSQLKQRSENVTLRFVRKRTFCERLSGSPASGKGSALLAAFERLFSQFEGLMEHGFLAPSGWPKLRARPVALFGSAFSHIDLDHISSNLLALRMCNAAEGWLGPARFAHLYLTSALTSRAFCCYWHRRAPASKRAKARFSLGASGAISGVMAWYCIECFKRGATFEVNGQQVSPLLFWALYVAMDVSGLLRLGMVQSLLSRYLDGLMGAREKDEKSDDGEVGSSAASKMAKAEVGYDAHLGGALAGLLWQVIARPRR